MAPIAAPSGDGAVIVGCFASISGDTILTDSAGSRTKAGLLTFCLR
jgi:hypothetical protein